jgi:hypothetical protein
MKVKKFFPFLILFTLILSSQGYSQIGYSPKIDSLINLVTTQSVSILDRQLSGDTACTIGGSPYTILSRHWNFTDNQKAAQYIYERFLAYGYTPRYQNNSATSVNVLAVKTGTKYPNQYFVICSHYDSYSPTVSNAPGADDNATGTVAVLEAARILKNFPTEYSIIFATYDEEERGLYGSKAFVDTSYFRGDSIVCGLNFDMIGYDGNNDGKNWVVTNTASEPLANDYISAMKTYVPTLVPEKHIDLTANSDHASFWTRGYKAFMDIEDENDFTPYYHTINDKFNTLNIPFFRNLVRTAIAALTSFANNIKMDFYHTPLSSGNFTTPRTATVVIKAKVKIGMTGLAAPRLYYKINSGSYTAVNYNYYNLDTFKFTIPGTTLGNTVSYYFAAQDSAQSFVCTYPAGGRGLNPPGSQAPLLPFTYTIESVNYACVGTGTASSNYPFTTYWMDGRTQMLFTAAELNAAGLTNSISRIGFNVITASPQVMNGYSVKFQHSTQTSLSGFVSTGWTTAFSGTYTVPGTGWQYLNLTAPYFTYNGTSNLLVEVCYDNSSYTQYSPVNATSAPGMTWGYYTDNSTGCTMTGGTAQVNRPNICFVYQTGTGNGNNYSSVPAKFNLSQNYPNPFNPVTKINFALPVKGFVTVKVFNILGKEVATLVSDTKEPGYYSVDFNASNLSSGVYYYKLESGSFSDVKKMMLIK